MGEEEDERKMAMAAVVVVGNSMVLDVVNRVFKTRFPRVRYVKKVPTQTQSKHEN